MDSGFLKTLFIGLPMLIFAFWQYVSVSRELEADRRADEARADQSADAGHPEREE